MERRSERAAKKFIRFDVFEAVILILALMGEVSMRIYAGGAKKTWQSRDIYFMTGNQ